MVKFPFDSDQEEVYIGTLTNEGATAALAKMTTEFEAYKKKTSTIQASVRRTCTKTHSDNSCQIPPTATGFASTSTSLRTREACKIVLKQSSTGTSKFKHLQAFCVWLQSSSEKG